MPSKKKGTGRASARSMDTEAAADATDTSAANKHTAAPAVEEDAVVEAAAEPAAAAVPAPADDDQDAAVADDKAADGAEAEEEDHGDDGDGNGGDGGDGGTSKLGVRLKPDPFFTIREMREFGKRFVSDSTSGAAVDESDDNYRTLVSSLSESVLDVAPIAAADAAAASDKIDLLRKMVPDSARSITAKVKEQDVQLLQLRDIRLMAYRGIAGSRLTSLGLWIAASNGLDKAHPLVVEKLPKPSPDARQEYKVLEGNHRVMAMRWLASMRGSDKLAGKLDGMSWDIPAICLEHGSTTPDAAMAYAACTCRICCVCVACAPACSCHC